MGIEEGKRGLLLSVCKVAILQGHQGEVKMMEEKSQAYEEVRVQGMIDAKQPEIGECNMKSKSLGRWQCVGALGGGNFQGLTS